MAGIVEHKPDDNTPVSWKEIRVDESDIEIVKSIVTMYFDSILEENPSHNILLGKSHEHVLDTKTIFTCSYAWIPREDKPTSNIVDTLIKEEYVRLVRPGEIVKPETFEVFRITAPNEHILRMVRHFFNKVGCGYLSIIRDYEENKYGNRTTFECTYAQ